MMTTVGDKNLFAIEWNVTGKSDDGYEYANFCFWVSGIQLGDYEDEIILSSTIGYLEVFLSHFLSRTIGFLCGRSKEDIFSYVYDRVMFTTSPDEHLHDSIISSATEKLDDYSYLGQLRERFHLDDVGGSSFMDKLNVILFNDSSTRSQRMIWRDLSDMSLHEVDLPESNFDEIAKKFLAQARN